MAELTIPQLDFSSLGQLPKVYQQAQRKAAVERTLASLGQGSGPLDYNAAVKALLPIDPHAAMTLASLGNNQRDFAFREQEAQRSQGNTDRSFGLQKEQADAAARGYDYREIETPNGKEFIRIHKQTGQTDRVKVGGQEEQPNNPYMTGGAMNEAQSKDALYASRMMRAEGVLRSGSNAASVAAAGESGGGYRQGGNLVPGPGGYGVEQSGSDVKDRIKGAISDKVGYNIRSPQHQKFDQAKRDFINATLRRESGAVISNAEFDNGNKQYFPIPGDTPELVEQKRLNRMEAIRGIGAGAGKGYRPEQAFNAQGEIIANPSMQRGAQPALSPTKGDAPPITSKEQFDALPSGTRFTAPDGSVRVKP